MDGMFVDNADKEAVSDIFDRYEPSKTRIKKHFKELRDIGSQLQKITKEQMKSLGLTERLVDVLEEGKQITSFIAKKRHLGQIAKLMQHEDIDSIKTYLDSVNEKSLQEKRNFHYVELWRDRLVQEGKPALTEFLFLYNNANAQYIRQMVSMVKKEQQENKPMAHSRKLFRYLQESLKTTKEQRNVKSECSV